MKFELFAGSFWPQNTADCPRQNHQFLTLSWPETLIRSQSRIIFKVSVHQLGGLKGFRYSNLDTLWSYLKAHHREAAGGQHDAGVQGAGRPGSTVIKGQ